MKRMSMCIALLVLGVAVAGCTKSGGATKKPAKQEKPSGTAKTMQTAPTEHRVMKPVVPAGTERTATTPESKKLEIAKPETKPETKPDVKPGGGAETKTPPGPAPPTENK